MRGSRRAARAEAWVVFVAAAALVLHAGLHALGEGYADPSGTEAARRAAEALARKPHLSLSPLDAASPPLPGLLYLPVVAACEAAGIAEWAPALLCGLLAGLAVVLLWGMLRDGGLTPGLRWLGVGAVVGVWYWLAHAGALSDWMAAGACALVGVTAALCRWYLEDRLRDLLALALWLGVAVGTRYELALVLAGVMVFVAARSARLPGGWRRVEGTLVTLCLPSAYVLVLWLAIGPGG